MIAVPYPLSPGLIAMVNGGLFPAFFGCSRWQRVHTLEGGWKKVGDPREAESLLDFCARFWFSFLFLVVTVIIYIYIYVCYLAFG